MKIEKYCPLLVAGNIPHDHACMGPECAWWVQYRTGPAPVDPPGACALKCLAGTVADLQRWS